MEPVPLSNKVLPQTCSFAIILMQIAESTTMLFPISKYLTMLPTPDFLLYVYEYHPQRLPILRAF